MLLKLSTLFVVAFIFPCKFKCVCQLIVVQVLKTHTHDNRLWRRAIIIIGSVTCIVRMHTQKSNRIKCHRLYGTI